MIEPIANLEPAIDISMTFRVMSVFIAVWSCLSAVEHLFSYYRLEEDGLLSWRVMEVFFQNNIFSPVLMPFLSPNGFRAVLLVRLVGGVTLGAAAVLDMLHPLLFFVLMLTDALILYRCIAGLSGAYHMVLVLNVGMVLATAFPEGSIVRLGAILFMAIQGILSYFLAGVLKLTAKEWRDGSALTGIFATHTFGHQRIYDLIKSYPVLSFVGGWIVVLFEVLFPVVLFVDPNWTPILFGVAFSFHLFNSVFMGLNGFTLIFPASYFPIYYANLYLHQWVM